MYFCMFLQKSTFPRRERLHVNTVYSYLFVTVGHNEKRLHFGFLNMHLVDWFFIGATTSQWPHEDAGRGRGRSVPPRGGASSLRLFVFSSLRLFVSSSLRLFVFSSLRLFVSSSFRLFVSSSFRLFISSSFHLFVSSSLHLFNSSSLRLFISLSREHGATCPMDPVSGLHPLFRHFKRYRRYNH